MSTRNRITYAPRLTLVATYAVLIFGAALIVFPLLWAFLSALKPNDEIFKVPIQLFPSEWQWGNFLKPFETRPFARYFLNSLLAAGATVVLTLTVASLAGYSLAKYKYPGKQLAFLAILSTLMLPVQVILVPLYLVVRDLGWLDTFQGLVVPQGVSAFSIFLMRQHFMTIPDDYMEAARLDGASELTILLRVIIPMSRPAMAAVTIFAFLGSWDSYVWPLVSATNDSLRTLPLGLSSYFSEYSSVYNQALAAAVVIVMPVLIVFLILQRQFVEGLTRSGLK